MPRTVTYSAVDTATGQGKTGDVANHTMRVTKDGVDAAANNAPAEVANGEYKLVLDDAEVGVETTVHGSSATANVVIIPRKLSIGPAVSVGSVTASIATAAKVGTSIVLEAFKSEARTFPITVVDGDGDAIDLTGLTLRFVAFTEADTPVYLFHTESVTVTGASNNIANVALTVADTAQTPNAYGFRLWDMSGNRVLAHGTLKILRAIQSA